MKDNQRVVLYAMPDKKNGDDGHPFLVGHRSRKNKKDKYVLNGQFMAYGLFWPNSLFKSRDDLAKQIGLDILNELGVV